MVHISACNRKGFEEITADVSEVIVMQAPTGYYEVVGKCFNGRNVAFTHIKRVHYQTDKIILGRVKFEWISTPCRVRVHSSELEVTRCSE